VALIRARENEGENQHISLETIFALNLAGHIDVFFSRFFLFVISSFAYCSGECCFLPSHSLAYEIFFLSKNTLLYVLLGANSMCIWASTFSTNQRKRNFYKRWRHEWRHRGPPLKIALGPLPFNLALPVHRGKTVARKFSIGGLCVSAGGFGFVLGGLTLKLNWFIMFHISIWGDLELCLGGLSPQKPPLATGLHRGLGCYAVAHHIIVLRCSSNHQSHVPTPNCSVLTDR